MVTCKRQNRKGTFCKKREPPIFYPVIKKMALISAVIGEAPGRAASSKLGCIHS